MKSGIVDTFCGYHPIIEASFFAFVMSITMLVMHPVLTLISFFAALTYVLLLMGKKAIKMLLFMVLPMLVIVACLNPLFNHEGVTVLTYMGYNPITLESVLYGIVSAFMLSALILWFSCLNKVIESDKLMYLLGRIMPSLSIVVTMALRFVPEFTAQIKRIDEAQRVIGMGVYKGSIIMRAKYGMHILSIMVTYALENAIITADSMKARGFGMKKRTHYSMYRFEARDGAVGLFIAFGILFIAVGISAEWISYKFFPLFSVNSMTFESILCYALFCVMAFLPSIMRLISQITWRRPDRG